MIKDLMKLQIKEQGRQAFKTGLTTSDNPYTMWGDYGRLWYQGWNEESIENGSNKYEYGDRMMKLFGKES